MDEEIQNLSVLKGPVCCYWGWSRGSWDFYHNIVSLIFTVSFFFRVIKIFLCMFIVVSIFLIFPGLYLQMACKDLCGCLWNHVLLLIHLPNIVNSLTSLFLFISLLQHVFYIYGEEFHWLVRVHDVQSVCPYLHYTRHPATSILQLKNEQELLNNNPGNVCNDNFVYRERDTHRNTHTHTDWHTLSHTERHRYIHRHTYKHSIHTETHTQRDRGIHRHTGTHTNTDTDTLIHTHSLSLSYTQHSHTAQR